MTTPKAPPPTLEEQLAKAQATADRRGKLLGEAVGWVGHWQLAERIRAELEGT